MEVGKERRGWVSVVVVLCLASALVLLSVSSTVKKNELGEQDIRSSSADQHIRGLAQSRHLTGSWGPGSYPPRCAAKCGDCSPCSPVHVPVPPGTPVTTEYYPEAWRCKCGNKLYMP